MATPRTARAPRLAPILIPMLLAASAGACFRSPDMAKLSCTTSARCPGGTQCIIPPGQPTGICQRPGDAGGIDLVTPIDLALGIDQPGVVDIAPPAVDSPSYSEASAAVDTTKPLDTTPDLPAVPDLGTDQAMGTPSVPDAAADNPLPDATKDSPLPDAAPPLCQCRVRQRPLEM
jgi:hypothetical protein